MNYLKQFNDFAYNFLDFIINGGNVHDRFPKFTPQEAEFLKLLVDADYVTGIVVREMAAGNISFSIKTVCHVTYKGISFMNQQDRDKFNNFFKPIYQILLIILTAIITTITNNYFANSEKTFSKQEHLSQNQIKSETGETTYIFYEAYPFQ